MGRRPQLLADSTYEKELERLRMLKSFPELPIARQEMIRAMRAITATDARFLHDLITHFVDLWQTCPLPLDLRQRAGAMRKGESKALGSPSCEKCGGSGWLHSVRKVHVSGMEPYYADCSERCLCAPPAPTAQT